MSYNYADAFATLPKLERLLVRLRAYESILTIFYAEEIHRCVVDLVQVSDAWRRRRSTSYAERAPKGSKNVFKKALQALVDDGNLSVNTSERIVELVNFRNDVGHRVDHIFSDLQQAGHGSAVYELNSYDETRLKLFDHDAAAELKRLLNEVHRLSVGKGYVSTFSYRGHLLFSSSERSLEKDILRTRRAIQAEILTRRSEVEIVNEDLRAADRLIRSLCPNMMPDLRFEMGRMTPQGEEICYRLMDRDISLVTICHLFQMKMPSIRCRFAQWRHLGGKERSYVDFASLPIIVAPRRYD